MTLVADGTLAMAQVYSGYIAGELPAIEIVTLWGVYPDNEITYKSQVSLLEDLEKLVLDETGGVVINHNWFSGVEQYFFCKERIDTLEDFKGKKTRSHSAALSDWINGMGAAAQFVAFAEVYTALERGILDCGVTGADPAYGQRWYEVTSYMNGPLPSFTATNNIVNSQVWDRMPEDLQKIFLEEGARAELEQLRLTAIQNEVGTEKNLRAGLELVRFSDEINAQIRDCHQDPRAARMAEAPRRPHRREVPEMGPALQRKSRRLGGPQDRGRRHHFGGGDNQVVGRESLPNAKTPLQRGAVSLFASLISDTSGCPEAP